MSHLEERRIDRFIQQLLDNATLFVSGEKLAASMHVSRQTICNWVHALQAEGLRIEIDPHAGYRLAEIPDLLMPQLIRRGSHATLLGRKIRHFYQLESTSDTAMALALQGEPEGTVVIAEEQTRGRGRMGRNWFSEKGSGIYLSILLRPALRPRSAPLLSLMTAVAMCQAIENVSGLKPDIKWPNDVLLGGKKCGGILAEMNADLDHIKYAVVGVGFNINQTAFPEELQQKATSLNLEGGRRFSRVEWVAHFLSCFENCYQKLSANQTAAIIGEWSRRSSFAAGKQVTVEVGNRKLQGTTTGLAEDGTLRVRLEDGSLQEIASGEILTWS
jgi:BirA family biotin operon repressor/biotin-[acetyl-CoA-carboxylase] ligase